MAAVEVVGELRYVLTLTKEEARTLLFVCNQVGGPPSGRRGHFDSIGEALSGAGLEVPTTLGEDQGAEFELHSRLNYIYFK